MQPYLFTYLIIYFFTYLLPYLLRSRILVKKRTGSQLVKQFSAFYGIRRYISAVQEPTTCPYPQPYQSSPSHHPISWRSTLILSYHLRLGLPSYVFPSDFSDKTLYAPVLFRIRATFPIHLIIVDLITRIIPGEYYISINFSLCGSVPLPCYLIPS